ncbi:hypothetical protein HN680_02000 [Candidatus Peregrinibacteria bacterium]|nr:hypothetical protein [Candidatus Peregrinibacteria bacterium]
MLTYCTEGINTKLKLIKRISYGFRNKLLLARWEFSW